MSFRRCYGIVTAARTQGRYPMKKLFFIFLLVLTLALVGCSQAPAATEAAATIPTLPSVPTEMTPLEILTAALDKTGSARSCTVEYGKQEDVHTQSVTAHAPFDTAALYAEIGDFPTNENLLADFCAQSLRAIPSNSGTVRYELSGLTPAALAELMYGSDSPAFDDFPDGVCTAAIVVDGDGCFCRMEFILDDPAAGSVIWFLSVTDIQIPE